MSYESESNQDVCNLDMEKGLHVPRYPQKFVHAPKSLYPQKNLKGGMKCDPGKIMSETMFGK